MYSIGFLPSHHLAGADGAFVWWVSGAVPPSRAYIHHADSILFQRRELTSSTLYSTAAAALRWCHPHITHMHMVCMELQDKRTAGSIAPSPHNIYIIHIRDLLYYMYYTYKSVYRFGFVHMRAGGRRWMAVANSETMDGSRVVWRDHTNFPFPCIFFVRNEVMRSY